MWDEQLASTASSILTKCSYLSIGFNHISHDKTATGKTHLLRTEKVMHVIA